MAAQRVSFRRAAPCQSCSARDAPRIRAACGSAPVARDPTPSSPARRLPAPLADPASPRCTARPRRPPVRAPLPSKQARTPSAASLPSAAAWPSRSAGAAPRTSDRGSPSPFAAPPVLLSRTRREAQAGSSPLAVANPCCSVHELHSAFAAASAGGKAPLPPLSLSLPLPRCSWCCPCPPQLSLCSTAAGATGRRRGNTHCPPPLPLPLPLTYGCPLCSLNPTAATAAAASVAVASFEALALALSHFHPRHCPQRCCRLRSQPPPTRRDQLPRKRLCWHPLLPLPAPALSHVPPSSRPACLPSAPSLPSATSRCSCSTGAVPLITGRAARGRASRRLAALSSPASCPKQALRRSWLLPRPTCRHAALACPATPRACASPKPTKDAPPPCAGIRRACHLLQTSLPAVGCLVALRLNPLLVQRRNRAPHPRPRRVHPLAAPLRRPSPPHQAATTGASPLTAASRLAPAPAPTRQRMRRRSCPFTTPPRHLSPQPPAAKACASPSDSSRPACASPKPAKDVPPRVPFRRAASPPLSAATSCQSMRFARRLPGPAPAPTWQRMRRRACPFAAPPRRLSPQPPVAKACASPGDSSRPACARPKPAKDAPPRVPFRRAASPPLSAATSCQSMHFARRLPAPASATVPFPANPTYPPSHQPHRCHQAAKASLSLPPPAAQSVRFAARGSEPDAKPAPVEAGERCTALPTLASTTRDTRLQANMHTDPRGHAALHHSPMLVQSW